MSDKVKKVTLKKLAEIVADKRFKDEPGIRKQTLTSLSRLLDLHPLSFPETLKEERLKSNLLNDMIKSVGGAIYIKIDEETYELIFEK